MEKPIFKATAIAVLVFSMFTASMVAPAMLQKTGVVDDAPNFFINVKAADATPSGDESLIINIYITDATEATASYDSDISEGDSFVYAHFGADQDISDGATLSGNIPYNTDFDIVVEVEYNDTVAWNVSKGTSGEWDLDYSSSTITDTSGSPNLGLSSVTMTEGSWQSAVATNTGSNKVNFYVTHDQMTGISNGIAHGETVEIDDLTVSGFW